MDTQFEIAKARWQSAVTLQGKPGERDALISALTANDPNGCYTDADMLLEFGEVASTKSMRDTLAEQWAEEMCRDCGTAHPDDMCPAADLWIDHGE